MGMGDDCCFNVIIQKNKKPKANIGPCYSYVWHPLPDMPAFAPFLPFHPVVLSAPDTVLIERNLGKRIDPQTGGMAMATPTQPHGVSETLVVTARLPFPELAFCSGHPQRDTRKAATGWALSWKTLAGVHSGR